MENQKSLTPSPTTLRRLQIWPNDKYALKNVCEEVPKGEDVRHLIIEMINVMAYPNGIGLAANQLGEMRRVIVFCLGNTKGIVINPQIEVRGKTSQLVQKEGCLSFPGKQVWVPRHRHILVTGFNENWRPLRFGAKNFKARVIQHEVDHLDGITMCDREHQS